MSFIYLASPYTDPDPDVMQHRFEAAERVTAQMLKDGEAVYSPIVHCHELARRYDLPKDFDFWEKYNFRMLAVSCEVAVLRLDGWAESKGVGHEISIATRIGIPVTFK